MATSKSLKNIIKYFEEKSTKKVSRTISGEEYESIIPPKGFQQLWVSYGGLHYVYQSFQWFDYANMLKRKADKITSVVLKYSK